MRSGSSPHPGIAAVIVFGIGLMLVGKIWTGLGVLCIGALSMAFALSPTATKVFFLAVGALIASGFFAYYAASSEITGKATCHRTRHSVVTVTREDSAAKFREVTNFKWMASGFWLAVCVVGFAFYRKLDNCPDDFY